MFRHTGSFALGHEPLSTAVKDQTRSIDTGPLSELCEALGDRGYGHVREQRFLGRQRGQAVTVQVSLEQRAIDAVIDYADKFRDQIVVVDHATTRAQKDVGAVHVQPPIREFLALLAVQDKILRVKKASFRKWLYDQLGESPTELIAKLMELGSNEHKASVSAGIANTVNARVTVLDIDLKHPAFMPMLEDYDAE